MKLILFHQLRFFQIVLVLGFIHSYHSTDLLEECSNTEDGHETRGPYTCCSKSPRQLPLQPALDFHGGWKRCAVPPKNHNEDPVISAWRVYRCIVFLGIRGRPLLPTTYTNHVTAKYPGIIKSKILTQMSELENADMTFEVDAECLIRTPYPKVTLIRNLFYEIEQEVCEGGEARVGMITTEPSSNHTGKKGNRRLVDVLKKPSKTLAKDLAEILCDTCDRRQEVSHRNGDCCSQVSIPFPFIYLPSRYENQDKIRQCAEDAVDDVGLPSDTVFATHLKHLCFTSCQHYLSGTISEADLWSGSSVLQSQRELKIVASKMLPKYFSTKYKDDVLEYVLENFRSAWQETKTFESKELLSQRDLRNVDKGKLKNLLASCKAHKLIETVSTLYLNNLCFEKYTSNEKGLRTTPRYPSSPSHFNSSNAHGHSKPVPANDKGGQDVILDFDWNQEDRRGYADFDTDSSQHKQKDSWSSPSRGNGRPSSSSPSRGDMRPSSSSG